MPIDSPRAPDRTPAVTRLRRWFLGLFGAERPSVFDPDDAIAIRRARAGQPILGDIDDTFDERGGKPDPEGDPEISYRTDESHVTLPCVPAVDLSASGSEVMIYLEEEDILEGFKFVGEVFDAEARAAAFRSYPAAFEKAGFILSRFLDEASPADPQLKKFHAIKRDLVQAYHKYARVTAALTGQGEPLRKPEEVLAWDECALETVQIPLAEGIEDPLSLQQNEFYRFFVEITVLFDIVLDDAGETLKSYNTERLSQFVKHFSEKRLIYGDLSPVDSFEGYADLSEDEKAYAGLVERLTILLDQSIEVLCDLDALEDEEHRAQIITMRELMMADRRDLVRMIAFAAELDDMIHDVEGARHSVQRVFEGGEFGRTLTRDHLPTRAEMNAYTRRNIFLRFMIMGRHIQLWRNMSPEARSACDFKALQKDLEAYGSKLDSLGNAGNDIGSLPKELREGTLINSILAKALEDGDITIEDLMNTQVALNAMSGRDAIGLLGDILNAYYSNVTNVNWKAIEVNHSDPKTQPVIFLMKALLKPNGAFISCLKVWDDELKQLSANTSEMKKLYDVDRHTQVMVDFLMRYIQASLLKLKL